MFYVLSSHNIHALKRQFKTLAIEETTVIINTLDLDYSEEAVAYCSKIGVRFFVTDSDGSAATGKNSFLDQFDKDGIPYAVLVDGDDYLTARGVKYYKKVAAGDNPPDVIVLKNPIYQTWPSDRVSSEYLTSSGRQDVDPSTTPFKMNMGSTVADWEVFKKGDIIKNIPEDMRTEEDTSNFINYANLIHYGMGIDEIAARVVFMSREGLKVRYREEFVVGEDTYQYLELKDLHEKGELRLFCHNEKYPTYIYDVRISGIAVTNSYKDKGKGFLVWMEVLSNRLQELKDDGRLHNTRVEEWPTV